MLNKLELKHFASNITLASTKLLLVHEISFSQFISGLSSDHKKSDSNLMSSSS